MKIVANDMHQGIDTDDSYRRVKRDDLMEINLF